MADNQTIKNRLISYISSLGISTRAFERECGLSNGYVNSIRKSIQPDKLDVIAEHYPTLSKSWLMTGEGTMLKVDATAERPVHYPESGETPEQANERLGRELDELKKEMDQLRSENASYKEQMKVLTKALDLAMQARGLSEDKKP